MSGMEIEHVAHAIVTTVIQKYNTEVLNAMHSVQYMVLA
jgi:hypothetical protein